MLNNVIAKPELDETQPETGLQHRKQRDEHQVVKMADQVSGADQRQGFNFGPLQGRVH